MASQKKWGGGIIHEDFCPTVVANEFRSVGNVIWEVEDDENESNQTNNAMVKNG
jgi:hypothetical protein